MANNKRTLIGAEALFVGPTPSTGLHPTGSLQQLHRVQNFSYEFNFPLENVVQAGDLAPIDQVQKDPTSVTFNGSWNLTSVRNESGIGLYVGGDQSALRDILNGSQQDKNYFVRMVPNGSSANGYTGTDGGVYGFGNGILASYQSQGQVGNFPTASFSLQCLNQNFTDTSVNIDSPAIIPENGIPVTGVFLTVPTAATGIVGQPTVLKPGNVTVDLNGAGIGVNGLVIQSYNLSFDLNLEPIQGLGSDFPTDREPRFPIECRFSVEALVKDIGTGNLANLHCNVPKYDLGVTIRKPTCDGTLGQTQVGYLLKGSVLQGQQWTDAQGANKTVTLNFQSQIGSAEQLTRGLFISGSLV